MRERRAIISAWQSLSASPRSLMYSPLMHLVPVETQMTCASFTSVPVGGGGGHKKDTSAEGRTSGDGQVCRSRGDLQFRCIIPKTRLSAQHGWVQNRCKPTCCHDDSRQDFPSRMRRAKVVCELTEFVHHQTRDGISQNLKTHTGVYTRKHGHTHTHTKLLSEASASSSVSLPRNSEHLSESIHREKRGCPPRCSLQHKNNTVSANRDSSDSINLILGAPKESNCKLKSWCELCVLCSWTAGVSSWIFIKRLM